MEESRSAEEEKLDVFSPLFVTAMVLAFAKDFASLFLLGIAIPVVGQVIAVSVLALTAFVDLFLSFAVLPKLRHFMPKLILCLGFLPLPIIGLTPALLALAIVTQNRLVELLLTQAAIQGISAVTAGAGEALNVAEKAAEEAAKEAARMKKAAEDARSAKILMAGKIGKQAEDAAEAARTARRAEEVARGTAERTKRWGGAAEMGLRAHERKLLNEEGPSAEEVYGLKEPTEKMEELFEPEYKAEQAQEENELAARLKFEAQKRREMEERRRVEYGDELPLPIPLPPKEERELELEKAA